MAKTVKKFRLRDSEYNSGYKRTKREDVRYARRSRRDERDQAKTQWELDMEFFDV